MFRARSQILTARLDTVCPVGCMLVMRSLPVFAVVQPSGWLARVSAHILRRVNYHLELRGPGELLLAGGKRSTATGCDVQDARVMCAVVTDVLYQPNSTRTREEDIMVDGNKLNSVLEFTYIGSTISSKGCIDDEIRRPRLVHLSADYARDSGTTTIYPRGLKASYTVQSFCPHSYTELRPGECMRHLRSIMRITWMDKVTNKEILERTGLPSVEDLLIRKNLRWTGHLMIEDVTRQATEAGSLLPTVFW